MGKTQKQISIKNKLIPASSVKAEPKYPLPAAPVLWNEKKKPQKDQNGWIPGFSLHEKPLKSTILDARSVSASYTLLSSSDSLRAENKGGAFGEGNPCVQPELGPEQDNIPLLPFDVVQHLLCTITGRVLCLGGTAMSH